MGRKAGSKNVSKELKDKIVDMVRIGVTQRKISEFYSISIGTVKSIVRRHKLAGVL